MTMISNRETAIRFLQSVTAGQPDLEAIGPNATWWVIGRPAMPMAPFLEGLSETFPTGGKLEILGVMEEGNRVALEASSSIDFADGRTYSNVYHFLVVLNEGKVISVKEYCDTAYVNRFFGGDHFG